MVFSSVLFVFIFLPVTLLLYYMAEKTGCMPAKNAVLLTASLVFYAWGGLQYLLLLLALSGLNYLIGLLIGKAGQKEKRKKLFLFLGIALDLGVLCYYKYLNFIVENVEKLIGLSGRPDFTFGLAQIALPVGISFFTFQIISYLIDVYRGTAPVQKNAAKLTLYIMMFPQLIAGPIVRYADVNERIECRTTTWQMAQTGVKRFIIGFAKKVFLANAMGNMADAVFALTGSVNTVYAWLGIICYALQIFFDFSAYSDMALGLGLLFGFRFRENFDYPYISTSIREFWRRWHISLSAWFRDYVYIPLGGNRRGERRTYLNLFVVFLLTGIWHGAAWQYVVWGLFHGFFLILERAGADRVLKKLPTFLQRVYTLLVVLVGWVFFRADSLKAAGGYLKNMFVFQLDGFKNSGIVPRFTVLFILLFVIALLASTPIAKKAGQTRLLQNPVVNRGLYLLLWGISVLYLAGLSYNPFIYFKF